jgi:hypothetical protein
MNEDGHPPVPVADSTAIVGEPFALEAPSPSTRFTAVFEDDGETGYLYGLDRDSADQPIIDALHVYNVASVTDRSIPSRFQVVWSSDGMKVGLFINGCPHAVFDFAAERGYCRTGFPPPSAGFSSESHAWDGAALVHFRETRRSACLPRGMARRRPVRWSPRPRLRAIVSCGSEGLVPAALELRWTRA